MTFILAKRPVAAAPISVSVYDQNGVPRKLEFIAQYQRHTSEQIADLQDSMSNRIRSLRSEDSIARPDGTAVPIWKYSSDIDFIQEKLIGWLDVEDGVGAQITFTRDALTQMVTDFPEIVTPLFSGFYDAHREAKEKN